MLKKLEKLENKLNESLGNLIALWLRLLHWILPPKFFEWKQQKIELIRQKLLDFKAWLIEFAIQSKDFIFSLKDRALALKAKIGQISVVGDIIKAKLLALKTYLLTTPLKTQFKFIIDFYESRKESMQKKIKQFTSSELTIGLTALVMIVSAVTGMYYSSQEIYHKEFTGRSPASNEQEFDYKPDYKMYPRRTSKFFNIKVPVNAKNVASVNSITIDFSVRTTTRFAKIYLQNYEYKLKDYFFTNVEAVVSDFPMTDEGKDALTDKIRMDVDKFLEQHGVEGKVEEVRILFIVGS